MNLSQLIEYNTWANRRLLTQIESLPADEFTKDHGGSFGTLKATLIHVLESDWLWLNRWKGIPLADIPAWQMDDARSVNNIWRDIQNEMGTVAQAFANEPAKPIDFVTRKGQPFTLPFGEIVIHLSHHGSYHRGQLANMIRSAGHAPVSTDYFIFSITGK